MRPIRTKIELLNLAAANAPTNATARKIREDGAHAFGGVTSPEGFPGWIVQAPNDRLIGIWLDERHRKYRVSYPDKLPTGAVEIRGVYL